MKFEYEEGEDFWVVAYPDLDLKVVASTKEIGTEAMLNVIVRVCNHMLGFYGRTLGYAQEALEMIDSTRGRELH